MTLDLTDPRRALLHIAEYDDEDHMMFDLYQLLDSDCAKLKLSNLPKDIQIVIHDDFCNQWILNDNEKKGYINRLKAIPYYDWNPKYSVKTYGLKMIEVMKSWPPEGTVIPDENPDHDREGENFYIWYDVKISDDATIEEAIAYEQNLEKIFESQTETLLSKGELSKEILSNEMSFSLDSQALRRRHVSYGCHQRRAIMSSRLRLVAVCMAIAAY